MSKSSFELGVAENGIEAQALNEEVVASAAMGVNNVPACESVADNQSSAGDMPAEVEHSTSNGDDQAQEPLMKERVIYTLKKKTLNLKLILRFQMSEQRRRVSNMPKTLIRWLHSIIFIKKIYSLLRVMYVKIK